MDRAEDVIRQVRQASASVAVTIIEDGAVDARLSPGADPITQETIFEVGSVTKTFTALLLAQMISAGEATLETRVGDVIPAGDNGGITIGQLATHTSGLPRLPHNLMAKAQATPQDPYSTYDAEDLTADLRAHPVKPGAPEYSNYGYMLLGFILSRLGNRPLGMLMADRVFGPLGMTGATFDAATDAPDRRVQGYLNNEAVPHWTKLLPGAGGVEASINDITAYLRAQLDPPSVDLEAALEMTQRPQTGYDECLAWQRAGSVLWHNGGTGGFSTFVGFDRSGGRAVGLLTNMGGAAALLPGAGLRALGVSDPLVG